MIVSIETPVFKGVRLQRAIDSVLYQSSPSWRLSLLWDGGDETSRRILEELDRKRHPNVTVHFGENRGIARARRFLSEHSEGELILPLDDDDALPFHAVERFLAVAAEKPWASVIRARRAIIDLEGKVLDTPPWFPFEPRHYQNGMVTDVYNHSQPYLIRRAAYDRTSGWEGFEDFSYAGEDCDIYLKLEEKGTIELLDEVLYYYRVHDERASLVLTDQAAFEMWRRLADRTIARIGLPLRRINDKQPFVYERLPRAELTLASVDFVVGDGGAGADGVVASLAAAGVSTDAVHVVAERGPGRFNAGLRRSNRPLVCFVDPAVAIDGDAVTRLLRSMDEHAVDLAAPRLVDPEGRIVWAAPGFAADGSPEVAAAGQPDAGQHAAPTRAPWLCGDVLLVRREVAAAVDGVDDGYQGDSAAIVDFCLKARQRGFHCAYLGQLGLTTRGDGPPPEAEADRDRRRRKWVGYADLFAPP